jgi:hypothetical protein
MPMRNVKATCNFCGEKAACGLPSPQLDDQAGDNASKGKHRHKDGDYFHPISGPSRSGGFCVHPFIPGFLRAGTTPVIVTDGTAEADLIVG